MEEIRIDILNKNQTMSTGHYFLILLVIKGGLDLYSKNEKVQLKEKDVYIINCDETIELHCLGAYALFYIDRYFLMSLFNGKDHRFYCDSTKKDNDSYDSFRRLLMDMIVKQKDQDDYAKVSFQKRLYELILFMVHNFGTIHQDTQDDLRVQFKDYVYQNFRNNISLEQISLHFSMTPQYFSKLFKEKMGHTFLKYLRSVQLEYALKDLVNTNKSVLSVSLDNGFPNVNSFYSQMQAVYKRSLEDYLRDKRSEEITLGIDDVMGQQDQGDFEEKDVRFFEVDAKNYTLSYPFFKEVINLPSGSSVHDSYAQKQLEDLQKELKFKYARIPLWKQEQVAFEENVSFFYEERVLDYLFSLKFKVWFVIDFRMIKNTDFVIHYLDLLLSHFSNRYSIDNIRLWRFEIVYNTIFDDEKIACYRKVFDKIKYVLMKYKCEDRLLGPGLLLSHAENTDRFVRAFNDVKGYTFTSDPYRVVIDNGVPILSRTKDIGFLKNCLERIHEYTLQSGIELPIYVTEWNDTIAKYDMINDSCYKGALIIKTIIDAFGLVQTLVCGNPLDVVDEKARDSDCLFGCRGLVSKHGIKKPSFYAYSFLNRLAKYYLGKDDHSIIMHNGQNNYQILCHNCKSLNYKYYLQEADGLDQDMIGLFEDLNPIDLHYRIQNVRNGKYICKIRSISPSFGSVQDSLRDVVDSKDILIQDSEIQYLNRVSTPKERLEVVEVKNGCLELSYRIEPNSFYYIHIIYQY